MNKNGVTWYSYLDKLGILNITTVCQPNFNTPGIASVWD